MMPDKKQRIAGDLRGKRMVAAGRSAAADSARDRRRDRVAHDSAVDDGQRGLRARELTRVDREDVLAEDRHVRQHAGRQSALVALRTG